MRAIKTRLTTSQTSRMLGVHESSIKRWCDQEALSCDYTPGGHRRLDLATVIEFAAANVADAPIIELGDDAAEAWLGSEALLKERDGGPLVLLAYEWLMIDDREKLAGLLTFLLSQGHSRPVLFDAFLAPLTHKIGSEWRAGVIGVGDEHRMMQDVFDAVRAMRTDLPAEDAPVALVATCEGCRHEFGAMMVRLTLETQGWRVIYLGGDVPMEDIAAQQRRANARLICISLVPPLVQSDVHRTIRALSAHYDGSTDVRLALGGAATSGLYLNGMEHPFSEIRLFDRIEPFVDWAAGLQNN
jgi:MerR family transcriptional regulator, light-induced transcriptional regulator